MANVDVSVKNTKNEILDAYESALHQIKELKKQVNNKQEIKHEQEKQEIIQNAALSSTQEIVKRLADLKLAIVDTIENLGNQLLDEHKKFMVLQQATAIKEKELQELFDIKANAESLSALLQAQKQKKEVFEKNMVAEQESFESAIQDKRAVWKKEQEEFESARKEQENLQKKLRQREEEEYAYRRDLERKKEQDQYEAKKQFIEKEITDKKAIFEKEFSEREAIILSKENELANLRAQVEEFPQKLRQTITDSENALAEKLKFTYDYEAKLAQKEVEGERKLHQQMINGLELKIAQQEQQIKELNDKSNFAGSQVQEIAVKAIEGASRQRFYTGFSEKTHEAVKT